MELGLACGQEDDFKLTLLTLDKRGAGDLDLLLVGAGVGDFDGAAVADLKTVVVGRS